MLNVLSGIPQGIELNIDTDNLEYSNFVTLILTPRNNILLTQNFVFFYMYHFIASHCTVTLGIPDIKMVCTLQTTTITYYCNYL